MLNWTAWKKKLTFKLSIYAKLNCFEIELFLTFKLSTYAELICLK